MASSWRTYSTEDSKYRGVEVMHAKGCPAREDPSKRCRKDKGICTPRYRKRVGPRGHQWRVTSASLSEVVGATAENTKAEAARKAAKTSRTFEDVAIEWWSKFVRGRVPKRRGSGPPSTTTINGYRPLLFKLPRGQGDPTEAPLDPELRGLILREWGHRPGESITEREMQRWFDSMPWSRSRIDEIAAVVRGIYAYACRSTRAIWKCEDPTRNVQLPSADKTKAKKLRVVHVPEARELIAALPDDVATPYAMSVGTGLRRSEIARADWTDVHWKANKIRVPVSKSEAGEFRMASISRLGMKYLKAEFARQGFPTGGLIVTRSVFSGKLQEAADKAWEAENERRKEAREPLLKCGRERGHAYAAPVGAKKKPACPGFTLQEGRHTYASMLLAARYSLAELMENMGHDDLAATRKYLKKLPQPDELNEADRLHNYEDGFPDDWVAPALDEREGPAGAQA